MKFAKLSLYFMAFCLLLNMPAFAQSPIATIFKENSQFVGVQFNPYFHSLDKLWDFDSYPGKYKTKVYSLRYGIEFNKHLYGGVDVSGMWTKNGNGIHGSEFKPGIFGRYNFFGEKKVQLIIEPGIYYVFGKYHFPMFSEPNSSIKKFGWYTSAGMGFNLYKKKVTLDLMVKYSPDIRFEGYRFVPTYRLNYHFK